MVRKGGRGTQAPIAKSAPEPLGDKVIFFELATGNVLDSVRDAASVPQLYNILYLNNFEIDVDFTLFSLVVHHHPLM